ncbi:MAG: outer membrane lipoprotein carrier protein LolA [Deltaproteobacteria bacterium]|nr:outer membrane lipoprotein carrier protein LolA [Deltaproteobacteria bacterium]
MRGIVAAALVVGLGAPASARPARQVAPVVATAPEAAVAVDKVQAFYAKVTHLTAAFQQAVTTATFADTRRSAGHVWIARPGKMRWDYDGKPRRGHVAVKRSVISNGTYLYVVEHDNKQVFKKDVKRDLMPAAISFLYGKGDLKTAFTPAIDTSGTYGTRTDVVLALTPKQPSAQFTALYLVVDPATYRVKESIVVDSSANVNHFTFDAPDTAAAVPDSLFEFDERGAAARYYKIHDADAEQAKAE